MPTVAKELVLLKNLVKVGYISKAVKGRLKKNIYFWVVLYLGPIKRGRALTKQINMPGLIQDIHKFSNQWWWMIETLLCSHFFRADHWSWTLFHTHSVSISKQKAKRAVGRIELEHCSKYWIACLLHCNKLLIISYLGWWNKMRGLVSNLVRNLAWFSLNQSWFFLLLKSAHTTINLSLYSCHPCLDQLILAAC